MASLIENLRETSARHPKRPAVLTEDAVIPYRRLLNESERFARALLAAGAAPGDRIAALASNRPEYVALLYGIFAAGASAVPLNTFLKPDELVYILEDCEASILFFDAKAEPRVAEIRRRLPRLRLVAFDPTADPGAESLDSFLAGSSRGAGGGLPAVSGDSIAQLIYTSGTTGKPKGVMLSQENLAANVESCRRLVRGRAADRFTVILPMFHSFTLTVCVHTPIRLGGGMILARSLNPFQNVVRLILRRRATVLVGIPQLFDAMARASIPRWIRPLLRIRLAISGGAALSPDTLERFQRNFRFPLREGYGLTEASPVVAVTPLDGPSKPGSVGRPVPGVEIGVVDSAGNPLPPGEVGEIVVRGPNVMIGYWKRPEESRAVLREGWLYTGDLGKLGDDGYLSIVGRSKELILVRGLNVYPREIEERLRAHPEVAEAAVTGIPDPKRGEAPVAFVIPEADHAPDPETLRGWCREALADYKVPRAIRIVQDLPRTATGKLARAELARLAGESFREAR